MFLDNGYRDIFRVMPRLCCISLLGFQLSCANILDSEFDKTDSNQTSSQIVDSNSNIVNAKDVSVKEHNGTLRSDELEVIDLFPEKKVEEKLDYSHCADFYKQASVDVGGKLRAIRLKNIGLLGYSRTKPNVKGLIKYDPFIGLFLASDKSGSKYAYDLSDIDDYALNRELASVSLNDALQGRFKAHQRGFLDYASFSAKTTQNGVISNICYRIYGLSTGGNGFIEKRYIDRFLHQSEPYYGDIGVRFKVVDESNATFAVEYSDPFFPNNPFKRGDILISINDIAPKDWAALEFLIADLELDSIVNVKIRRNDEAKSFDIRVGKRYGGMLMPDSFLERFPFSISNDFVIEKVPGSGPFSKLRRGDRILFINDIDIRQFKLTNDKQKAEFFQELFTRIQNTQVDFIEQKKLEEETIKNKAKKDSNIIEQFQQGDVTKGKEGTFQRKLTENLEDFVRPESSPKEKHAQIKNVDSGSFGDIQSFGGDGILRDSDTQSIRSIYDVYGEPRKSKKDKIIYYEELEKYGGVMTFLIDRGGFQFRVPLN